MSNDERVERLLQNFCYDTESIALYTNKESAPRLFALLDSLRFTWSSKKISTTPLRDEDLIFLNYETRRINHLSLEYMFDSAYDNVVYFSANRFVDLFN